MLEEENIALSSFIRFEETYNKKRVLRFSYHKLPEAILCESLEE